MDPILAISFKGFLELIALFIGAWAALSLAKYLIWRSGACVPGKIPCK